MIRNVLLIAFLALLLAGWAWQGTSPDERLGAWLYAHTPGAPRP